MVRSVRFGVVIFFLCIVAVCAQEWSSQPGYVDFSTLGLMQGEKEQVEVFLDGNLLNMVAEAGKDSDPELTVELKSLQLIQAKGYAMRSDLIDPVSTKIESVVASLERSGWKASAKMRMKKDDQAHVYMKIIGGKCVGIMAIVMNKEKIVLVNIVGRDINTARLGKLGKKFNIESLKDVPFNK